jgi:hypothetical protein
MQALDLCNILQMIMFKVEMFNAWIYLLLKKLIEIPKLFSAQRKRLCGERSEQPPLCLNAVRNASY